MNLQDSKASDAKTLQSQNSQNTKIRILLSALRVIHGRLSALQRSSYMPKYRVGEAVNYTAPKSFVRQFKVVKIMPVEFPVTDRRYRIKCETEAFERTAWEYELSASAV
jgi:hypothetical protein